MASRVLVTGAGGFIGSHLVEALVREGRSVRAMVRYNGRGDRGNLEFVPREVIDKVDVIAGDVTDPFFVRNAVKDCEQVFHLAALIAIPFSYIAPRNVFDVNVMGTLHVAQACLDHGASMVHTSTSEVYGTAQTVPIAESHPRVGQSPYAASKIGADQCVGSFVRSFGLRAVTVRPFNTYGPRQSARAVIPTIIAQALTRDVVRLGSLHTTRDLNYVGDTVDGFLAAGRAVDNVAGREFNLGTGREISIGDLATKIFELLGKKGSVELDPTRIRPAASEVERLLADSTLAQRDLGWTPRVSFDEGLTRTIDHVRAHLQAYRPDEYAR